MKGERTPRPLPTILYPHSPKDSPPSGPPTFNPTHSKYSQQNKGDEFKQVPLVVVVGVEEDKVPGEVRVHELEGEGGG